MITGSIVALVTPMHLDGAIDWSAFARLIEYHIESGTAGLGIVGTIKGGPGHCATEPQTSFCSPSP